ncbi:MAG: hypothetical protein VX464_11550 [Pseudomonadota bacterium]|nr:hypothetical protein [Pseudomonadota bacterium]
MSILERSKAALDRQHAKGLAKYGAPLDDTKPSALALIDHAIEEAADQLQYLVALRDRLMSGETSGNCNEDSDDAS